LSDLSIGIIGYGDIGKEIARTAKFFNMKVFATKRTTLNSKDDILDEIFGVEKLHEMMEKVDYLINITPSTEKTKHMLSNSTLKNCKPGCVFINIGRGNVIDEESILNALDSGWIDKAILDVFEVEPLPKESKLWKHEKVVITPHVSGVTFPQDISDLFIENLKLYESNQPLKFVVNWDEGY
jgi:phosphoglycerate dehydrogenase-like enzyme